MDEAEERLLVEAGRAVRPYLPALVGEEATGAVDGEVARLLAEASRGVSVGSQLAKVLSGDNALREWTAAYFEHGLPPEVARIQERAFEGLPGLPQVPEPDKYVCRRGDYTYFRRTVGIPVPQCPTHQIALVPASPGA